MAEKILIVLVLLAAVGCATPQPMLYPNAHLQRVGQYQANQDVDQCRYLADQYVRTNPAGDVAKQTAIGAAGGGAVGAVTGAITGDLGSTTAAGAAAGATIGLLRGGYKASQPQPTWKRFVEQCLRERGYQVIGWQ